MANVSAGLALSEADQLRWQEFVATPEDLAAVMDWLADGRDGPISFQCVMPGTGALVWLHEHKLRAECSGCAFAGSALCPRANGNWLILAEIGDAVITPDRV